MNTRTALHLQAERSALEQMLAHLPQDRVIERSGLQSRLESLAQLLAAAMRERDPARALLTFRGKPVVGTHGIFANFGAAAVETFTDAVAAMGAAGRGPLGTRGQLPDQDDFRLLITGTALGSFGFELEEAPSRQAEIEGAVPPVAAALRLTLALLQASLESDDQLTQAVSETEPRAIDAMRDFLETMAKAEAVCSFAFEESVFRFSDVAQVRRSLDRLRTDNIHETSEELIGAFLGVLPERRTFEFRIINSGKVIVGKVGPLIDDATVINHTLDRAVVATVKSRRVGDGNPRYELTRIAEIGP